MISFLTGWLACAVSTVVVTFLVEFLTWAVRSPEWRLWMMNGMTRRPERSPVLTTVLFLLTWPVLTWFLARAVWAGQSVGEQVRLEQEARPENTNQLHWLDVTRGPVERFWVRTDVGEHPVRLYLSRFRLGEIPTHLLLVKDGLWGAFRVDPGKGQPDTEEPFAVSSVPDDLVTACENDVLWFDAVREHISLF